MSDSATIPTLPRRIHEACLPWVRARPQGLALKDVHLALTYGELLPLLERVGSTLSGLGVRAGDRVLLVGENSVALAVTILALSRLDAWSATINPRLSAREVSNFNTHSGARRVLYFSEASPAAAVHGEAAGATPVEFPVIGRLLVGALAEAEPEAVFDDPAEQVAALVYTSGTAGAAKAVMLTHRNLVFIGANSRAMRGLVPEDHVYGVLPLSHVYGLASLLLASLGSGASLQLVPQFAPAALAKALAEDGVTVFHGVPAMYARLLDWCRRQGLPLSAPTLRVAQAGGSPLTQPLKQAFEAATGLILNNGYGMTETAPSICQTRMDAPRSDCSVGQAIPGVELRVHQSQGGEGGDRVEGELWVRGPNVMKGYYHAPEATAEVLTADGWLRTGDVARIDADGAVFIVGRAKELIIRSGFNVYPVEVEQVLNAHPDVVQSAVVGRAVADNEEVIAFVEVAPGHSLDLADLQRHLRDNLSPYKIPARIEVLAHLPAAATGKILKAELRRMADGLGNTASR